MMHEMLIVLTPIGFLEYTSGGKRPVKVICTRAGAFIYKFPKLHS